MTDSSVNAVVMERPAPSEPRDAARKRLALAVLAGLLSPAKKFPDGKSRPGTAISGKWEPHGGPPVGHTEPLLLRAESSGAPLLKDTHGSLPWLRFSPARLLSLAVMVGHWRGAGPLCLLPHTVYSRPGRCFQNSRCTTSSNGAHGSPVMPPGTSALLRHDRGIQHS